MTNDFKYLTFEEKDCIGLLTLKREDKLNALNNEVLDELRLFLESAYKLKLKGLIFTGAGEKSFIAGADIAGMKDLTDKEAVEFAYKGQHVTFMLEELRFPVIAAVNGYALGGGCEMALACDFILATQNAVFGLPEVSLGIIPGFGGTQRLSKIIGRHRAKEMIYTGRKVKANEAKDMGLVLSVHENKESLLEAAKEIIEKASANSLNAIGVAKFVINRGVDLTNEEGLKFERNHFGELFNSYDMKEGISAFVEKRKPSFKGE